MNKRQRRKSRWTGWKDNRKNFFPTPRQKALCKRGRHSRATIWIVYTGQSYYSCFRCGSNIPNTFFNKK